MKKILVCLSLLISGTAFADPSTVYFNVGPLGLTIPFENVSTVALYDFIGKRPLAGGETEIFKIWKIDGTLGAVISPEAKGAPYVGTNLDLGTPLDHLVSLGALHFGGFAGYSISENKAVCGFKASMKLWD